MKDKVSCGPSHFSFSFHNDPQETEVFYVNVACMQKIGCLALECMRLNCQYPLSGTTPAHLRFMAIASLYFCFEYWSRATVDFIGLLGIEK